jgi:YgiT-type zinc finger domain-containing protein
MKLSKKCPVCSGKLVEKKVEKFLKGNGDTAIIKVKADVCLQCGTKLYDPRVIARFTEVKKKLKQGQTKGFILIGKSYKAA